MAPREPVRRLNASNDSTAITSSHAENQDSDTDTDTDDEDMDRTPVRLSTFTVARLREASSQSSGTKTDKTARIPQYDISKGLIFTDFGPNSFTEPLSTHSQANLAAKEEFSATFIGGIVKHSGSKRKLSQATSSDAEMGTPQGKEQKLTDHCTTSPLKVGGKTDMVAEDHRKGLPICGSGLSSSSSSACAELETSTTLAHDTADSHMSNNMNDSLDTDNSLSKSEVVQSDSGCYDTPSSQSLMTTRDGFPVEFWNFVPTYLSAQEMRKLRLVSKRTASELGPHVFRSAVVKFGRQLFNVDATIPLEDARCSTTNTMLRQYGSAINKFGIAFEYDLVPFVFAPPKKSHERIESWYGGYNWPVKDYPRFGPLKDLEDLVENHRWLLNDGLKQLTKVAELALSIDSGHGWFHGSDLSDLALWKMRLDGGTKVFGPAFEASDKLYDYNLRQYFKTAQQNSIDAGLKYLAAYQTEAAAKERRYLQRIVIREYDSFLRQAEQPDFNPLSHIGTDPLPVASPPPSELQLDIPQTEDLSLAPLDPDSLTPSSMSFSVDTQTSSACATHQEVSCSDASGSNETPTALQGSSKSDSKVPAKIMPQWPLIFNCHNLAAQVGGDREYIQSQVANPVDYPIWPDSLTEAQAQWLMETLWAQRSFLAAYTNSVIANKYVLKNVHSLHVAKISSNLLPSLEQQEFWTCLPNLKHITLLVIPDWRREHVPGDQAFHRNMILNPVDASTKLAHILRVFIRKLEKVSSLTVGYVGGGEHAIGMYARNDHVLPAPISSNPIAWLKDTKRGLKALNVFSFDHIRTLTFQNCWFSPAMLEAFMRKSRDTSLHHLVLDSVSLTGKHNQKTDEYMTVKKDRLRCEHEPEEWLHEEIEPDFCWVNTLDQITPGTTIMDLKYKAGLIEDDEDDKPKQSRKVTEFRGNIETITLKSCGYVKIRGMDLTKFSQRGLVMPSYPSIDGGLLVRQDAMYRTSSSIPPHPTATPGLPKNHASHEHDLDGWTSGAGQSVMMSTKSPRTSRTFAGLGRLTSCIHPVEKRILEEAWSMKFGWGDTMDRWAAVEDGYFEGGTGRFSGVMRKK